MIVTIYFFGSGGQQSDAGGGLVFCGYILWFMFMIVIISILGFMRAAVRCRRWFRFLWLHTLVPVYDCYHLFLCFMRAAVRCRKRFRFLWLRTLVPVYDSFRLYLCFMRAAVRCRRWFRFLCLHILVPVNDCYHLLFGSGVQQSDAEGGIGFCGYILWFLSMIVIIYFFVSCRQQSDARGSLGLCGYILWFLSMIVIICFFVSSGQ